MKTPGYIAVATGEVIHVIKCISVECKIRQVEGCFAELPMTHGNRSAFLLSESRIIMHAGTPRDCSEILPAIYKTHGTWFRLMPSPVELPPIYHPVANATHLEIRQLFACHQWNLLRRKLGLPAQSHNVPCRETADA